MADILQASVTRTVKFFQKAGTYHATIVAPNGDVYERYASADGVTVDEYYPDYSQYADESQLPRLFFVCSSSRSLESVELFGRDDMEYWFNNHQISKDGEITGSLGDIIWSEYFEVEYSESLKTYGLRIKQNLAEIAGLTSCNIKMQAAVASGDGEYDYIEATYPIRIEEMSDNAYDVTIYSPDSKGFVLSTAGDSCKLAARIDFMGVAQSAENYKYTWYKQVGSGLEQITSGDGSDYATITVSTDDVTSYTNFIVEIRSKDGATKFGTDSQQVMDKSDPWDIDPNPRRGGTGSTDSSMYVDPDGGSSEDNMVFFFPKLVGMVSRTAYTGTVGWRTKLFSAGGFPLSDVENPIEYGVSESDNIAAGYVSLGHCTQAGGNVEVLIEAYFNEE